MNSKYCTVRDLNYTGEILHGTYSENEDFYIMDDGDCYKLDVVSGFDTAFFSEDPRKSVA